MLGLGSTATDSIAERRFRNGSGRSGAILSFVRVLARIRAALMVFPRIMPRKRVDP